MIKRGHFVTYVEIPFKRASNLHQSNEQKQSQSGQIHSDVNRFNKLVNGVELSNISHVSRGAASTGVDFEWWFSNLGYQNGHLNSISNNKVKVPVINGSGNLIPSFDNQELSQLNPNSSTFSRFHLQQYVEDKLSSQQKLVELLKSLLYSNRVLQEPLSSKEDLEAMQMRSEGRDLNELSSLSSSSASSSSSFLTLSSVSAMGAVETSVQISLYGLIIFLTLLGNVLVLFTIFRRSSLHNMSMYLVASLSVSDLMVGVFVMPLKVVLQIVGPSGVPYFLCLTWLFADIFFCTASIMTLCMIGLDRYWIMRGKVAYIYHSNQQKVFYMIAPVYLSSLLIALPSVVFTLMEKESRVSGTCHISQNLVFTLYSTVGAFYLPFVILLIIYVKIYKCAKVRWKRNFKQHQMIASKSAANSNSSCPAIERSRGTAVGRGGGASMTTCAPTQSNINHNNNNNNNNNYAITLATMTTATTTTTTTLTTHVNNNKPTSSSSSNNPEMDAKRYNRKNRVNSQYLNAGLQAQICLQVELRKRQKLHKREIRAITTVFVILSTFVVCWLPFFILALIVPFCGDKCEPHEYGRLAIDWLGYTNSALNPFIYAVFNLDFRKELKLTLGIQK